MLLPNDAAYPVAILACLASMTAGCTLEPCGLSTIGPSAATTAARTSSRSTVRTSSRSSTMSSAGAAGAAGREADGQFDKRRLVAQPFKQGVDALAEERRVVAGVRVAVFFVAGEQIEDQRGVTGVLQALGEVGLAGFPVVAHGGLGDDDQPGAVQQVALQT